jgi:hypothetical protein
MLSLGVGLQQMATRRLERTGLFDTVIVSRSDFGGFGRRARAIATTESNRVLDEEARREISQLPGVLEAVPDLRMMTQLRLDDKPYRAMVAALPLSARDREAFENIQGNFFSSATAAEVIVQRNFAEELLGLAASTDENSNSSGSAPELEKLLGKDLVMSYAARVSETSLLNGKEAMSGSHIAAQPEMEPIPVMGRRSLPSRWCRVRKNCELSGLLPMTPIRYEAWGGRALSFHWISPRHFRSCCPPTCAKTAVWVFTPTCS